MNRRWLTTLVRSVLLASIAAGVTNGAISQARTKSTGSTALPAIAASAGTPWSPETAAVSASSSASSSSQSGALDSQPEAAAAPRRSGRSRADAHSISGCRPDEHAHARRHAPG